MKFVLVTGPQAVGKMTVGQELAKITGLKLFHNHEAIELVRPLLSSPDRAEGWARALVKELRMSVFRHFARSGQEGMIYTMVWAFDDPRDRAYADEMFALWREECPEVEIYIIGCARQQRKIPAQLPARGDRRGELPAAGQHGPERAGRGGGDQGAVWVVIDKLRDRGGEIKKTHHAKEHKPT
ncbi:MAG: AAA family ATPase [Oscillospiraceae bacterium]|jgi:hypothetical protein|nr:AAA family ATPase [Oscillospiraceae bacterium]